MQQPASDWWRTWFGPAYLELYDEFVAERAPIEIDQLEKLLHLHPPMRILDLPCGQGRHAIELARRGYRVTGVDLSPYLLRIARQRAAATGVSVRWQVGDMRQPLADRFDVVLNLFTSFGYFADEADDAEVLKAAAAMLEPGGRFVVEIINGDRIMANFQEREWFTVGDSAVVEHRSLDRRSRRMVVERTVEAGGNSRVEHHALRLYGAAEIRALLRAAEFAQVDLYGDWDGTPASPDRLRLLAVATTKKGGS
jgi:SAM-dependent methyltransferase